MRKGRIIRAAVAQVLAAMGAALGATAPIDPAKLQHGYDFAAMQLTATTASFSPTQYPVITDANTGAWQVNGTSNWRAGFFPGQLWALYQKTSSSTWRTQASSRTDPLTTAAITHDHDIGFVTMTTWGQALHLGLTPAYRDTARSNILANAQLLSNRFKPAMGLIDSWENFQEPNGVCIDNMMNLELLFAAHALGGSQTFYDRALTHAQTSRVQHVRANGSTYHVVRHLEDGSILVKNTHQGYGDETTWSRGQAWAIHGFSTTYRYTHDPVMLQTARQTADYFLANLPANLNAASNPANAVPGDWVPPSDFDAEHGEPVGPWNDWNNNDVLGDRGPALHTYTLRDSSAAAVAASGLFELASLTPNDTPANQSARQTYFAAGASILNSLLTHADADARLNYLADGAVSGNGSPLKSILARGSQLWNDASRGTSYGDFYFIQAMGRYERTGLDFLPLSVGNQWAGGSGSWSTSSNWTSTAAPSGVGQAAHFRGLPSADTTVALSSDATVGAISFANAHKFTIAGAGLLRLEHGAEAQITVDASPVGGHEIAVPLVLASDACIDVSFDAALVLSGALGSAGGPRNVMKLGEGSLHITGAQQWSAGSTLRVTQGTLELASDAGAFASALSLTLDGGRTILSHSQHLSSLSIAPGATLDLAGNKLIVPNGNLPALTGLIVSGYAARAWNGSGIVTSQSDALSGYTSIGIATAAETGRTGLPFAGMTVSATDVLVMYTYAGDANLSGNVDVDDYGQIDFNASTGGVLTGWFNGDFDYNGIQDVDDYGIIDFVVNIQGAPFSTSGGSEMFAVAIPEPSIACSLVAVAGLLVRRRQGR